MSKIIIDNEASEKGNAFEIYTRKLFDDKYFNVVRWNTDICRKRNEYVESDSDPDIILRYKYDDRNEVFAIECKFRSGLYKGKLAWSNYGQMKRYKKYQEDNRKSVFIIIGLGGEPDNPERMFCIPLNDIEYPALFPSVFEEYEREPDKMFFWRNNKLT